MTDLPGRMIAVGRAVGDRGRSGRALVAVMKPADLGARMLEGGSERLRPTEQPSVEGEWQ
jgi:hypothetical protein